MNLRRKTTLDASNWHPDRIPILSFREKLEFQQHSTVSGLWINCTLRIHLDCMLSPPATTSQWKQIQIFLFAQFFYQIFCQLTANAIFLHETMFE